MQNGTTEEVKKIVTTLNEAKVPGEDVVGESQQELPTGFPPLLLNILYLARIMLGLATFYLAKEISLFFSTTVWLEDSNHKTIEY